MKHIDLFSGIGGFALAADRVWENVEHIFCDNDQFCQEIIKKHWPKAKIYGDIRTLTADSPSFGRNDGGGARKEGHILYDKNGIPKKNKQERKGRERGYSSPFGIDLLTGGFPCQPFSQAGRRRGTADDRYLWPEMLRVIQEFHPRWVVAENVGGFVTWNNGLVFQQVHLDLESEGYEVQSFIIPAVSVNAPHRRDRVWIVAHCNDAGSGASRCKTFTHGQKNSQEREHAQRGTNGQDSNAQNPISERSRGGMESSGQVLGSRRPEVKDARPSWEENWIEVATRLCRVDDGLPRRMDRNPRLKALGNAIVPQVAEEIFKAIKHVT